MIRSSGEENAGGIAALGKALVLLQRIGFDLIQAEERALTGRALLGLRKIPGLTVYGINSPESSRFAQKGGVIVFKLQGMMANQVAKNLAERGGIGVRYGCHCAHLLIKRLLHVPPLLEKFQGVMLRLIPRLALPGLTRVSLGLENSEADIDQFLDVLGQIARRPRAEGDRAKLRQQLDDYTNAAAQKVYRALT